LQLVDLVEVLGDRLAPDRRDAAALEELQGAGLAKAGERDPEAELGEQAEDPVSGSGSAVLCLRSANPYVSGTLDQSR
jgi:hypothetical protein